MRDSMAKTCSCKHKQSNEIITLSYPSNWRSDEFEFCDRRQDFRRSELVYLIQNDTDAVTFDSASPISTQELSKNSADAAESEFQICV